MGTKDSRRFRENYRREPSINEAFAYDAAQLVVESMRRASIEPGAKTVTTSMKTFLEGLNSNRNSLDGITGKLYFSKISRNIVRSGTMAYFKPRTGKIVPYPYVFLAEGVERSQGANKNDTSIGKNEELPKKNSDEKRRSRQLKIEKMPIINIGIAVDAIHDIDVSKNAFGLDFFLSVSNTADVEIKYPEEMFKLGRLHSGSSPLEGNYLFSTNDGGSKNHFLVRKKPKEEYPNGNNKGETNKYIKKKVLKYSETFEGDFDLYKFPFDSQVLKFEVTLDNAYGRKLVFWKDFFTLAPEIKLSKFWKSPRPMEKDIWAGFKLNTLPYIREFDAFDVSGNMTPVYQTQIKIARKWSPYVFSLFVPLAILCIVGMLSLEISPHRFPVRITLAVTTLLSMVVHHLSQLQPVRAVGQISVADILYVCLYGVMLCVIAGLISVNRRYTGEMSRLGLKEDDIFVPIPDTENYNVAVKILIRYIVVVVVCVVITLWKMQ
jgi:hypothetical protein